MVAPAGTVPATSNRSSPRRMKPFSTRAGRVFARLLRIRTTQAPLRAAGPCPGASPERHCIVYIRAKAGGAAALTLLAFLAPLQGAFRPAELRSGLRIEPARTRVGLASVHLEVSDLALHGNQLIGRYTIRVPLFPSKNDEGSIQLRAPRGAAGGPLDTLVGQAQSDDGSATREVICEVREGDVLRIAIATDDRVLTFWTRYTKLTLAS